MKIILLSLSLIICVSVVYAQNDGANTTDSISVRKSISNSQYPYKTSVGAMIYGAIGPSFKTFVAKNFSIQTDLLWHATFSAYFEKGEVGLIVYPAIELNTNFLYQEKIKEKPNSTFFWFIGGGVTMGCEPIEINGKWGVNAMIGLEYAFRNSLSLQIDFRQGYGMLFNSGEKLNSTGWFIPYKNPTSHFDWMIGLTLRKIFWSK